MSKIDSYHVMIVSKYFVTIRDFINVELVCKKFGGTMEKFHFNPIPLNSKTLGYFSNIETLCLWNKEDNTFGNRFMINKMTNGDIEDIPVFKKAFYKIIVWFNVNFETVDQNKSRNIEFKNVTYTRDDREKFGNIIPLNVTSIGEKCFNWCSYLSSITIPLGVTSFSDWCFSGCSSLSSMIIPSSVTSIGYQCFSYCNSLKSITIPPSVTSIDNYCFYGCDSLSSVTIPSTVSSIGNH
ncbi:leucine rich repeat containing protein BspA family protein, partial [Entamoeba invadens IP1]